jgi:hypothetical protein
MKVFSAKVIDGRLDVPEGSLQEGATVTVLIPEDEEEEGFRLSPEEQALLIEAMAQGERGEVIDGWKLLEELED